ncbi:AAA family ATPase [Comamonas jiangduensis]|uniref:AAA family ATPase n=1 Tax=Comamonas jiangduensis TaxID=1194168 RepID=UPI0028B2143E|nr:ATP-binding protein [Comamonas jiangduensis]
MLRNIYIKSFRSCLDLSIDNIDELTILVGRNGVGKSNILKAINWCASVATASNISDICDYVSGDVEIRVELDSDVFVYSLKTYFGEFKQKTGWLINEQLIILNELGERTIFRRFGDSLKLLDHDQELIVGLSSGSMASIFSLMPNYIYVNELNKVANFLRRVKYYPLIEQEKAEESFANVFISEEQFSQWMANRSSDNSTKDLLFKVLDFHLNKKDRFEELISLLCENGIGILKNIRVSDIELPRSLVGGGLNNPESAAEKVKMYFFSFVPAMANDNSDGYRFDSLSFGTKRLIRFVTDFLYDDATVSLVEQPEDGVHCGLLYKLFDFLDSYSEDRQTIVASHSADLLNRAAPSSIRLVEMKSGLTTVRPLSGQEKSAADEFKKNTGNLSEFLRSLQE